MDAGLRRSAKIAWWQWPFVILLGPIVVPLVLLILMPIFAGAVLLATLTAIRGGRRLRQSMTKAGRMTTWEQVEREAAAGRGTFILDNRTLGWNWVDVWWTPNRVSQAGGPPPPSKDDTKLWMSDHPFYSWAQDRYLQESHGQASLLGSVITYLGCKRLRRRIDAIKLGHAGVEVVSVLSAVAAMARRGNV